jgi:CTP-dependent riboflavin kinase
VSALKVTGKVVSRGQGHFTQRMTQFPHVFEEATGEKLITGTLNVQVGKRILIREHFRIPGARIQEPEQDLLFEVCRINGLLWGYRIRPYQLLTGEGGHGDDVLEITCSTRIPNASPGSEVIVEFFR